jgi:hypothetical protein
MGLAVGSQKPTNSDRYFFVQQTKICDERTSEHLQAGSQGGSPVIALLVLLLLGLAYGSALR